MTARLSLAQQLALLEEAAPVDLDPEDAHTRDVDAEDGLAVDPAAREHYFEVGYVPDLNPSDEGCSHIYTLRPSSLRKQHDSISDPKYEGVKTSRKMLEGDSNRDMDDESEGSGSDEDEFHGGRSSGVEGEEAAEDDEPSESGDDHEDDEEEEEEEEERQVPSPKKRPMEEAERAEDLPTELLKKREEDKKKGKAVTRQIALWDSLLDARIRIQKAVTAANRLPPPLDVREYLTMPECEESVNRLLKESAALSEEILLLQEHLLKTNESISPPPRKRQKLEIEDDGTPIDYAQWLEDATHDAAALEEVYVYEFLAFIEASKIPGSYHPHLVQTLAKWSSKIQAVAPSVLLPSNRGAFSKGSQNTKTVLQLIDETLSDNTKLLARTQIRRSKASRLGAPESPEEEDGPQEDPNIFDDTDFYQQLLRDVIDSRGAGSGGGDDWMALQKQKKAKKKVDTKASKGRKLRYEAHEKLQNFMVPVPVMGGWHEEQIDELFASLLGKGFGGVGTKEAHEEDEEQLTDALKGGFRLFG
ncbi:hypothetical protein C0991_011510 [Blastosporella zonata]|nr:hypothetical protein C0991_011510 [Blastosporella zonata]